MKIFVFSGREEREGEEGGGGGGEGWGKMGARSTIYQKRRYLQLQSHL